MIIHSNVKKLLPFSDLKNIYVVAGFDKTITTGSSKIRKIMILF